MYKWTKENYEEFRSYLKKNQDVSYQKFQEKLVQTKYEILGIRIPVNRRIAKEIAKSDVASFLKVTKHKYHEEIMIEGFVIANLKEKETLVKYLPHYIDLIDNWEICDGFCASLKIVKQDKPFWFSYFKEFVKAKEVFKIRVALVIFLNYFISLDYLEEIFSLIEEITVDSYYVNMAIAWLLCECFIQYKEETLAYLLKSRINTFTFNKTISKIKESFRVKQEDKEFVESLRRKVK